VLHVSPLVLGLLLATSNAGIIGAWLAPHLEKRLGLLSALGAAVAIWTIGRLLLPLASISHLPLVTAGLSAFIVNLASPLYNIIQSSYRQRTTPLALQARTHASMRALNSSTIPIGAAFGGALAGACGVTTTLTVCAVITACSCAWLAISDGERERQQEPGLTRAAA
jgi:predicted MFS family arabinose efflux permease